MMSTPDASPAPAPGPVMVYDGDCVLCSRTVRFVLAHERRPNVRFAAAQSEIGRALMTAHGFDPDDLTTNLVIENGRALSRSDTVIRLAAELRAPWRWAGLLRWLPKGFRDWGYDFVASRRIAWFGRPETCYLAAPEQRGRFLG